MTTSKKRFGARARHWTLASLLSVALLGCAGVESSGSSPESQAPSSAAAVVATPPALPPWKEFLKTLTAREQKLAMIAGGALAVFFFIGVGVGKSIRKNAPSTDYRQVT